MTKEQIVSWISQFPFLSSLAVIAVGLLLSLLLAWLLWHRRHQAWKVALRRQEQLDSETANFESRNRYFRSVVAERQKLAAETDWTEFAFVSPELAVKLKEYGIEDLRNLNSLSANQRAQFDSRFAENGVSLNWDSVDRAHASLNLAQNTDVDWGKVEGVDFKTAGELKRMEIKNIGELESMSPADRTTFEAELKQNGVGWDWSKLGNWKTALGKQSHLKGPHFVRSDVRVKGFAPALAETPKSSPMATSQGVTSAAAALGTAAVATTTAGIATAGIAGAGTTEAGAELAGTADSINVDKIVAQDLQSTEPPRLFESVPEWKDDLTLLDGIDDPQSRELRKMGIYNLDQLHNLPHLEQTRLQAWFRSKGWHLDMGQWRISSEGNTNNPSTESIQDKAYEAYCHRRDHHLCGDQSTDWEQAEWAMRGNPIWGYGVPHDVEDYSQSMTGVTEAARDELYRMGLHNRHQVELLNEQERRLLTSWFAGPRFGVDLTKAFGWLSTLKPAPTDLNIGDFCEVAPRQIDDLSRIKGIGNATESDLNRLGIYHFRQIADWTLENSAAVAEALGLADRTEQASWIEQAKMFSQPNP